MEPGQKETCLQWETFTITRIWSLEDQNFKYPYETELVCGGEKFHSLVVPLSAGCTI